MEEIMSEYLKLFSRRLALRSKKSCGQPKAAFEIIDRGNGKAVGNIALDMKARSEGLVGEIEVSLDTRYAGQGFSIEAIKRLAEYAYEDLGLVKLFAKAPNANLAAEYTLRRGGFSAMNKFTRDGAYKYFEATSPYFRAES
jgi:RimJ/RimL family protein N-acetyltransferase